MKQCYLYRIKYCSGKILYSFKTFSRTEVIITHTQRQTHTHTFEGLPRHNDKKIRLPMQEMKKTRVQSLGQEDPLEQEMATLLQSSCLGNPMDRGALWATVPGVAKSHTGLSRHTTHTHA